MIEPWVYPALTGVAEWLGRRPTMVGYQTADRQAVSRIVAEYAAARQQLLGQWRRSETATAMLDELARWTKALNALRTP